MTKQEAIDLEREVDGLISSFIGEDCKVSMALNGSLRVHIRNNSFNIKVETQEICWVHWLGDFDELLDYIMSAKVAIKMNKDTVNRLLETYTMKFD